MDGKLQEMRSSLSSALASGFDAEAIAKQLGISRRQLRRRAQLLFGMSLCAWLNEKRLSDARALLEKHRSVKVVAFELGFKQPSHFSRKFKTCYGVPPIEFLRARAG